MITLERTYRTAKTVEMHVARLLKADKYAASKERSIVVRTYHNGREDGFAFTWLSEPNEKTYGDFRTAFIAQNRSSDQIKLVFLPCGTEYDNVSEEFYKSAEYFKYNEHEKAAKRVLQLLFGRGKKYGERRVGNEV